MKLWWCNIILLLLLMNSTATDAAKNKTLTIAAFQPLTKTYITFLGRMTLDAARLAIQDINKRSDILPEYNLSMDVWDTEVRDTVILIIYVAYKNDTQISSLYKDGY